jgi:hypothetical protein
LPAVRTQFRSALLVVVIVAMLTGASCGGNGTVTIHGRVLKTVGRACSLLSAAFPDVAHRTVSFIDQTGEQIGHVATGSQRTVDDDHGGCEMSSSYRLTLPVRGSYAANVSSRVEEIPTSPMTGVDTLAAQDWRLDLRIPATA